MSRILLEILKHKAAKLGCFVGIGIFAAVVTVLSRVVLGWLHYDEAQQKQISATSGDGLIRVIVGGLFVVGLIMMARQAISPPCARSESRSRRCSAASPPSNHRRKPGRPNGACRSEPTNRRPAIPPWMPSILGDGVCGRMYSLATFRLLLRIRAATMKVAFNHPPS